MEKAKIQGVELAYEVFGKGEVPVVFLNGIAMTIQHWKPVAEALGGGYRFLCHDMRGQTLSEKPKGPYSLELHARDLASLMEKAGFGSAHVVGTSYGAEVAMAFAVEFPERTKSLTLIDGVSELDPLLRAVGESWLAAASCDPRVFYKTILPWNYSADFIAKNADMLKAREDGFAATQREWFDGFSELCRAFLSIDMTEKLNRITCSALVLVGENDILKPRKYSAIIAEGIARSRLGIVPGAGHAVVIERPDAIALELRAFLGGLEAESR